MAGDYSCASPRVRFAEGGRFLSLHFARSPASEWNSELFGSRGGIRGKCKGFSFGSRRRMLNRLNQVSVAATLPQFVGMTLPDEVFSDSVVEFSRRAKDYLVTFQKRLLRRCPEACGFWRIEWKARKSGKWEGKLFPHFHLLVWGLPERVVSPEQLDWDKQGNPFLRPEVREAYVDCPDHQLSLDLLGVWSEASKRADDWRLKVTSSDGFVFAGSKPFVQRCQRVADAVTASQLVSSHLAAEPARKMSFQDWASLVWYEVVDSHNPHHATAGVRLERVRSWGGVMSYAAKYIGKVDAESFLSEVSYGRNWGIFNRRYVPWAKMIELNLDSDVGVRVRRVARRYLEKRTGRSRSYPYGLTLYCDVKNFRRLWERPPPDPF